MGLSGRKVKQRIGKDPRNLSWADDASRFGQAYLEKFGWDTSKGLGASGEGRTSAIKAAQKLDMLGIGMRHQNGVDGGIAWRQNRDFEDLLRRLNGGTTEAGATTVPFHKARESESESKDDDGNEGQELEGAMTEKEKKKKKKKRKAAEEVEEEELEGLDGDKKERKKRRKKSSKSKDGHANAMPSSSMESESVPRPSLEAPPARDESGSAPMPVATVTAIATEVAAPVPVRAPPRTHRARIIAAKRMAASNSTALAEILGIPSSASSSMHPSAVASPAPVVPDPAFALASTTITTHTPTANEAQDSLQKLTTSSQSVSDYFKAKLGAKAHRERQAPRPTSVAAFTAQPASARDDDYDGRASLGLGGGPPRGPPQDSWDEEPVRRGIGAPSSSRSVTMFMPGQPTIEAREEITATASVELPMTHDATDHDDGRRKSEKRRAKEERRREKEERRRAEAGQVDRVTVNVPVDGAHAAGAKSVPGASDDRSEESHHSGAGGGDIVATKKGKKDKKSAKHRRGE